MPAAASSKKKRYSAGAAKKRAPSKKKTTSTTTTSIKKKKTVPTNEPQSKKKQEVNSCPVHFSLPESKNPKRMKKGFYLSSPSIRATMLCVTEMLHKIVKHNPLSSFKKPPAIVLDIDGTLICSTKSVCITPVVYFAKIAASYGIKIHIVTARLNIQNNYQETQKELAKWGLVPRSSSWKGIPYETMSLRSYADYEKYPSFSKYKRSMRDIIGKTHSILVNVGDQWDDLVLCDTKDPFCDALQKKPDSMCYVGHFSDCCLISVKLNVFGKL